LEKTGGVPEAIDLLIDGDPLTPAQRIERRMAALPENARAILEALAVFGVPADAELLSRVAGVRPNAADLSECGASPLVAQSVVDGVILFSYQRQSDRERAYALLEAEQRKALHGRCMEICLEVAGREQEAAHHAVEAGRWQEAVPAALEAARALEGRHAQGEAASLLEKVVNASPGTVPVAARERLASLYRAAGDYKRALEQARAVVLAVPTSPEAHRHMGELLTLAGQYDEAATALHEAKKLAAESGDRRSTIEVEALLAELYYQAASHREARQHAERALSEAQEAGELVLELHARNTVGKLALEDDPKTAAAVFQLNGDKAAQAGLGHQEAQALTNLGVALLRHRDLTAAEQAFGQAIKVAERAYDTRDQAIATENLAVLAHLKREYGRAQTHYHEAVGLLKRLGNRSMLARVAINLGELYLSLGEMSRARTLCDFAAHVGGTGLPESVAGEGLVLRGRIEAADGGTHKARMSFEAALRVSGGLGENRRAEAMLELTRVALAEGQVSEARALLASMPVVDSPKSAADVALVAADVERAAGSRDEIKLRAAKRALELARDSADPELLLPALVTTCRAHCDAADLAAASDALKEAQELERALTSEVPAESQSAWQERRMRLELNVAHAALSAALMAEGARAPKPANVPSGVPASAPSETQARWQTVYPNLVGESPAMSTLKRVLDKVAPTDALVLLRGDSGTGKELVAEAIHRNSARRKKPFVKVNCAALVETLLMSELFGHERGAFTGASARKKGRFELADGGTLFLDEIGDISPATQIALLRVLQEREFERVGGTQAIKVDVRIIAATHRDLESMVEEGTFREDLYYRLRGVTIETPALRNRLEDLDLLCAALLRRIGEERSESAKLISREALALLASHSWPGNVRELENMLRSATLFAETPVLSPDDFAAFASAMGSSAPSAPPTAKADFEDEIYNLIKDGNHSLLEMKKVIERECIMRALTETDGNITRAAALLGMKRPRLSQLVKQYELGEPKDEA
jgi:transcriptional regulator with GAF, ATPase, and Fis domain/Tfp pilus assembly protein PilF